MPVAVIFTIKKFSGCEEFPGYIVNTLVVFLAVWADGEKLNWKGGKTRISKRNNNKNENYFGRLNFVKNIKELKQIKKYNNLYSLIFMTIIFGFIHEERKINKINFPF